MTKVAPYAKAVIGALVAGLASLQQALDDGSLSAQEWTGVAIATLSGLALVWAIPNKDDAGEHQTDSVQPPKGEGGYANLPILILVALCIVCAVFALRG